MRILCITFIGVLVLLASCKTETKQEPVPESKLGKEISFYTPDSIQIFGDLYELDKQGKIILLFHQGGSNARGEYSSIIPKLINEGYNILAIDQRVGGQFYGSYNRTLANIPTNGFDDGYGYCDAYNNLESALDYIMEAGFTGDRIIWGSSYSAALAIHLAHNRQKDISGVLAFSPASGNAMKDCLPNKYFEAITIPLLILRPPHEMERKNSKLQSDLASSFGHQTYVPASGVHGSSMLVASRVGSEVDETWKVVLSFLKKI